jgi:tRNA-2-methylthio-N6-dimethylallyladenosine synthase
LDLLAVQNQISLEDNLTFLGKEVPILVEGPSKWSVRKGQTGDLRQMTGRTPCDRIVVWDGHMRQVGEILPVEVTDVYAFTMLGRVQTIEQSGQQTIEQSDGEPEIVFGLDHLRSKPVQGAI